MSKEQESPEVLKPDVMSPEDLGHELGKTLSLVETPEEQAAVMHRVIEAAQDEGVPPEVVRTEVVDQTTQDLQQLMEWGLEGDYATPISRKIMLLRLLEIDRELSEFRKDERTVAQKGVEYYAGLIKTAKRQRRQR